MANQKIIQMVVGLLGVVLLSGCTTTRTIGGGLWPDGQGMATLGANCLSYVLSDRQHFFCNNKDLRSWNERGRHMMSVDPSGSWKHYEKDLFSGRIYDTRKGDRCPRDSWRHWCLKSWHEERGPLNATSETIPIRPLKEQRSGQ